MRGPDPKHTSLARKLRRGQTSAEQRLWRAIRNRQLDGLKFVRQVAIGPYVADFACRRGRIVIELDGATHSTERNWPAMPAAMTSCATPDTQSCGSAIQMFTKHSIRSAKPSSPRRGDCPKADFLPSPRPGGEGWGKGPGVAVTPSPE